MRSFTEIKPSRNGEITLSLFTDVDKSCHSRDFFLYFNAICENKILANISVQSFALNLGPRGFGDLGRMALYFQGAGEH